MDTPYQKSFNVPMPSRHFDNELIKWLSSTHDLITLHRYIKVYLLHERLVKQADNCGDRNVIWHNDKENSYLEIQWKSHDIHMYYMNQIPIEEHEFYISIREMFYEYLETKKRLSAL